MGKFYSGVLSINSFMVFLLVGISVQNCALGAMEINLQDAVQMALSGNSQVIQAKADLKTAEAKTQAAWATVLPKIDLSMSYARYESATARTSASVFPALINGLYYAGLIPTDDYNAIDQSSFSSLGSSFGQYIKVSQLIFGTHALPVLKVSGEGLAMAEANLDKTKQDVIYQVLEAYTGILKLQEQKLSLLRVEQQLIELYAQMKQYFAVGYIAKTDLLRTEIQKLEISQQVIMLENTLRTSQMALASLIGIETSTQYLVADFIPDFEALRVDTVDGGGFYAFAIENRADIKTLQHLGELQKANVEIQGSGSWPAVFFSGQYGFSNRNNWSLLDENKDWSIAVACNWNLFDGFTTASKVNEAQNELMKTDEQIGFLKSMINIEIDNTLAQVGRNQKLFEIAEQNIELAKENFRMSYEAYKSGGKSNLELLDSVTKMRQAEAQWTTAKYDLFLSYKKLMKVAGKPMI